ncbi:MAG: ABC transporter substrate-binding protein [Eubacterium sp.]|nr:ABC transporter substrate-binding protein [Eubacterium sp.]
MKKRILAAFLAAAMTLSLAACGGNAGEDAAASGEASSAEEAEQTAQLEETDPVYGGSATFYYSDFNNVFDPAMGEAYTYSLWLEYLWAPNWGLDDPDTYNFDINTFTVDTADGQIAKEWSWENYEDGDGYSDLYVTIRDDIYFQEKEEEYDVFGGRNLTAADVVYTYSRLWGKGTDYCLGEEPFMIDGDWYNRFEGIVDYSLDDPVEQLGEYELVFHLATESESRLSELIIGQVNITGVEWETLTSEQQNDWHYACGTGPYILTDYQAGSYYKFERNENYYDVDDRHPENVLPYLDEVVLTSVTDNAAAMSSFISGDLDYISRTAYLSDDQASELISSMDNNLQVFSYENGANALVMKCNQEPFNDERVRIALQKAINLEEATTAYLGYDIEDFEYASLWAPALTGWSSVEDWDDELISEYTYDPEGAKALLEEAGYPDGFEFTVAIDAEADADLFQLAKSYFAEIGVTMEIEVLADMMEGREVQGNSEDTRQFNMTVGGSTDAGFAYQTWASDGFAYAVYAYDTEMDELLASTRDALTLDEQAVSAKAADQYFAEQHWAVVLSGQSVQREYLSTRIRGLENGELLSAYHNFKTFIPRLYAVE